MGRQVSNLFFVFHDAHILKRREILHALHSEVGAFAVLSGCAVVGQGSQRFALCRAVSAPVLTMLLAAAFAQSVTPFARTACWDAALPASLVLSLLSTSSHGTTATESSGKKNIFRIGVCFFFGALASILGAGLTCYCLPYSEQRTDFAKGAAAICSSYVGGSANFFAVANALNTSPTLTSALAAADIVVMALYFAFLGLLVTTTTPTRSTPTKKLELSIFPSMTTALFLASLIVYLSSLLNTAGARTALLALLAALTARFITPSIRTASAPLASIALLLFYAGLGSAVTASAIARSGPAALGLAFTALTGHLLCLALPLLLWRFSSNLLKKYRPSFVLTPKRVMSPPTLIESLVASNACIGGPSTAAAFAIAAGRPDLALPAVLWGTIGYALATSLGIAIYPAFLSILPALSSSSAIF